MPLSPDGKHVASASAGRLGEVKVWDAQTGQELLTPKPPTEVGGAGPPTTLAYSPDGKHLARARGGVVTVWNAESGKELLSLKGGGGSSVAFSPDGQYVAGGGKVWARKSTPSRVAPEPGA